jgi:hypothetical protein
VETRFRRRHFILVRRDCLGLVLLRCPWCNQFAATGDGIRRLVLGSHNETVDLF